MTKNIDITKYQAVFFDLDGTLIDSAKDLFYSLSVMSDELNIQKPNLVDVKNWIGSGALDLVEKSLLYSTKSKPTEKQLNQAFHLFSKAYKNGIGEHATLYEGTQKLLVKLLSEKVKLACITNKSLEATDFYLQIGMISQFFSVICAGDKMKQKKPSDWSLLHASNLLDVNISNCLMIGSSKKDVQAAKSAGCDIALVSYGYNQGEDISDLKPDLIINSFNDLI